MSLFRSLSTGDCALLGKVKHDKKLFIAQNLEVVKIDSARGYGEYLKAYASLSGCTSSVTKKFGFNLQSNFTLIFGKELNNSAEESYDNIEKIFHTKIIKYLLDFSLSIMAQS